MSPVAALLITALMAGGQAAPPMEPEAKAIETLLVAPCCFRQQVSEHQSAAADETRKDIRARLSRGATREQILAAYVSQHGERILASPPPAGFSLSLYVLPVVILITTVGVLAGMIGRFVRDRAAPSLAPVGGGPAPDCAAERRLDDELRDLD
jgi:cytochrome c-type biogenesis protein CcmH/NrfF